MPRRTLSVIVFVTGAAVLELEILAGRYMLPAFGTSLFIWGAVLSITLLSLAVGYRWGGALADRLEAPHTRLIRHILAAAAWIATLPLFGASLLRFGLETGALLGPVVVSLGLFAVPLTLLATSVPLSFGSSWRASETAPGRTLGDLFAISTAGSVLGALLTAYLAVPYLGLTRSFFVASASLFAVVFPALVRGKAIGMAILIFAVLSGAKLIPSEWHGAPQFIAGVRLIHRTDTRYAQVDVIEDGRDGSRILLIDGASQNWVAGRSWSESFFDYIPMITHHLRQYREPRGDALVLGLGAGTLVRMLAGEGYRVEVAELDPAVAEIAHAYFDFPEEICQISFGDGRAFLESAVARNKRYDVVVVDVAGGGHHPDHIYNKNSYQLIESLLTPSGVMVANMVVFTSFPYDRAARHSAATVADVFSFASALDLYPDAGTRGDLSQLLLFGSRRQPPSPPTYFKDERLYSIDPSLRSITDDWNPLSLWSIRANAKWHSNIREWLGDGACIR